MNSRMEKYKNDENIPTRSDKNQSLYKQVYNAYDEFENLIVPSNAREINVNDLKKEIRSRAEYRERKEVEDLANNSNDDILISKATKSKKEDKEVYDINSLLNKAVSEDKEEQLDVPTLSNQEYLKKLKLDNYKMKASKLEEQDEDESISEEAEEELLKTANLSLEILSDLKSDNDNTMVGPIKSDDDSGEIKVVSKKKKIEEEKDEKIDDDFYSTKYKFSRKDFDDDDGKKYEEEDEDEEEDDNDEEVSSHFFLKILMLVFGVALVALVILYFINYFNKV